LVEAGVPRATIEGMQGRIDQLTAAELRAMAKNGGGSGGKNPEMQALEDNYEMLRKEYEDARTLGEVSPELEKDYLDTRGELLKRRRSMYTPQQRTPDAAKQIVNNVAAGLTAAGGMAAGLTPAGSVAAGIMSGTANAAGVDLRPTGAAPPPPIEGPAAIPASVGYDQIDDYLKQIEEQKAKVGEEAAVAEQWTQQKSALQKRLEAAFPDTKIPGTSTTRLEAIARAVLNGDLVPDESGAVDNETGLPITIPASFYALQKIGFKPDAESFAETGNLRTGPQGVSNRELVKEWAEEFVNQRGLIDKEATAGALSPEVRQKARAKVLEQIDNG
jgi:hypothetical protein